jgi:hypothetical protein
MTSDTVHSSFGVFAVDPGLKDSAGFLLMTGEAFANLLFCPSRRRREK